jgi:anaerobic carbon-monoxide dehydrogenase catalytic subunit
VGVAPEWMSEKAIAIGCYFVASGIDVILGHPFHVGGSENVSRFLSQETRELFGASFHTHSDPHEAAAAILDILQRRRARLGINRQSERKQYDMKDRRALNV